jgi:hypothetical protein
MTEQAVTVTGSPYPSHSSSHMLELDTYTELPTHPVAVSDL